MYFFFISGNATKMLNLTYTNPFQQGTEPGGRLGGSMHCFHTQAGHGTQALRSCSNPVLAWHLLSVAFWPRAEQSQYLVGSRQWRCGMPTSAGWRHPGSPVSTHCDRIRSGRSSSTRQQASGQRIANRI